ncbi:hypothetical protein ACOMHN_005961 [Nucella lapillus]
MSVNVAGLVGIIVFYLLILVVGVLAARKTGLKVHNLSRQDVILAGRNIGITIGIFTTVSTWVGGGYINGTSEILATEGSGLVWCQAPIGFSISLFLGGVFFVDRMRTSGFTTMLDPFHRKFGRVMGCLLYLPALTGELFWSAAILNALGATLKVILDIDLSLSVIISAVISLLYTLLGGLYSVAYTDVVQLICMFIGLWVGIPFAMTHEASKPITGDTAWVGELSTANIGSFVDFYLLMTFGGIPWQVYWQRALSARSVKVAQGLSIVGAFGCFIMAIPAALFGAIAATADWNQTSYGYDKLQTEDLSLTLPLVYFHLTPVAVSFIGLGVVSAAVMSSTDSSILSSSSMFACNVFAVISQAITRKIPSDTVVVWVMRGSQVVIAALACILALSVSSIYYLFLLCSDLVYVVLFPQLLCVLFVPKTNSYGSFLAFLLGLLFRVLGGEPGLGLTPVIEYPWMDSDGTQQFPFRTFSMLISVFCLLVFSFLARLLFLSHLLPPFLDIFRCFDEELYPLGPPAYQGQMTDGIQNVAYLPDNQHTAGQPQKRRQVVNTRL